MATSVGCSRKTCDLPISRDSNAKYIQGDVYSLKESVYTPIYDILQQTFPNLGAAYARSQQSFNDITTTPDVIANPRPAIIMLDQDDDRRGLMVCLATTYSGKDLSELPRIFRHFSIPIAPHDHSCPGHLDHLHSLPEWGKENAWIIAWSFPSTATRDRVWSKAVDGGRVPWVFGRDAMRFLRTECDRKLEEWKRMCEDPELAAALEAELRVSATTYIQIASD
ncbi:hypothetical protein LXA43DRAFT_891186 [Ganoderma leucocontextum]|nr:hypothetical protein LXA43DRAFT_891186 [Ganoderma leucocontextum]